MKFATALTFLLAAPVSALVGLDIFEGDETKEHEWCCTDAECPEACDQYNLLTGGSINVDSTPAASECVNNGALCPVGTCCKGYGGEPLALLGGPELPPCCNTPNFFKEFTYNSVFSDDLAASMYCDAKYGPDGLTPRYPAFCNPTTIVGGDPHFKRWNGEWFDFHGECDLTFINAPAFGMGVGLDITIRTKQRHGYSYIESAAMRIGDDVLEVSSFGMHKLNGVEAASMEGAHLGPFAIEYEYINAKEQVFKINTVNKGQTIQMKTFKDLVDVKLERVNRDDFDGASGMMGAFPSGNMVARDGLTVIEDPIEFAAEWQVRADDPQLFATLRAPQHPAKCVMPSAKAIQSRRLGENGVSQEAAEMACAHHADAERRDNCVYDVKATGDLEYATAGAY